MLGSPDEDDNDLTAFDAEAVPSADEPDDPGLTAEVDNEDLEHDPGNPEVEGA